MIPPLIVALLVLLTVGAAASWWAWRQFLPRAEIGAGIAALARLHWRDFTQLVLRHLQAQGHAVAGEESREEHQRTSVELRRGAERSLLGIKHGSTAVLGIPALEELGKEMRLRGLERGHLATPGRFARDAVGLAQRQGIALLDGPALWTGIETFLPPAERATIHLQARRQAQRLTLAGWAVAALLALAGYALWPASPPPAAPDVAPPAPAAPPAAGSRTSPPASASDTAEAIPTGEAELLRRRNEVARSISALPMVEQASWSTRSTLLVQLLDESDVMPALCPLLERYPELAASRIQLQPAPGSQARVRFLQCRAF